MNKIAGAVFYKFTIINKPNGVALKSVKLIGSSGGPFVIDPGSLFLKVAPGGNLDREKQEKYQLRVRVRHKYNKTSQNKVFKELIEVEYL